MSKNYRLGVMVLCGLVVLVADPQFTHAERTEGGGNQSNRDRDRDEDDDDDESDANKNDQRGNRSSRSGDRTGDQINQLLQRGQGGQNNQSGQRTYQRQFRPGDNAQNLRFGTWQGDRWQGSRDVEKWAQVFGGGRQPFSTDWYKEHPKAWRHEHHDHDDIWITATLPGVYSWLGWGAVPQQPGIRIGNAPPVDLSQFHDFYPLGVYSLMSGPDDMGTRIVQLAIDRHGHIAGNYYDLITDTNASVSGDVRRQSQRVYWSLNKNKAIRFRVHISRLLQPYGTMTVQLPGGEQDWQFVRLEN